MVKASASGAEDPGFESRLSQDFFGSSHTSDLKIGSGYPARRLAVSSGSFPRTMKMNNKSLEEYINK